MLSLNEKTFIGWSVRGLDPISARNDGGRIVCSESRDAVRFTLFMGLLFGPGLAVVTVLLMSRGESRGASALTATFSLVAWYALYTSLFQRRRIVFDPATGTVELFRGRASWGKLSRSEIVSLDLKPVERTVPGVSLQNPFRWTNYLVSARLRAGRDVPLLESPVERTITELYRKIKSEFMRGA